MSKFPAEGYHGGSGGLHVKAHPQPNNCHCRNGAREGVQGWVAVMFRHGGKMSSAYFLRVLDKAHNDSSRLSMVLEDHAILPRLGSIS